GPGAGGAYTSTSPVKNERCASSSFPQKLNVTSSLSVADGTLSENGMADASSLTASKAVEPRCASARTGAGTSSEAGSEGLLVELAHRRARHGVDQLNAVG